MTVTSIGIAEIRRYLETRNYSVPSVEECEVFLEAIADCRLYIPYTVHVSKVHEAVDKKIEDLLVNEESDAFHRGWDDGYEMALNDISTLASDDVPTLAEDDPSPSGDTPSAA